MAAFAEAAAANPVVGLACDVAVTVGGHSFVTYTMWTPHEPLPHLYDRYPAPS